jgi:GDP-L-fucose synthase
MNSGQSNRIYVAGHSGLVGSALVRALNRAGKSNLVTRTHAQLDLQNQVKVRAFFASEMINEVYLAAATVGGIHANNAYPAKFMYDNLMIQSNVIHEAWRNGVQKLLFLGSSCIYPRLAAQPIKEEYLLSGALESTNEAYAMAKIAGLKLCESYNRQYGTDYRCVMPTNLYGPGDNYHPEDSHVIPGLLRRFHEAKIQGAEKVVIWGTGSPRREFLYVDDMAEACIHVMELNKDVYRSHTAAGNSHINIGIGEDLAISEVAALIAKIVGYRGRIEYDASRPDGTPRKLLDVSCIRRLGWTAKVGLDDGLRETYQSFCRGEFLHDHRTQARALDGQSLQRRKEFPLKREGISHHVASTAAAQADGKMQQMVAS